MFWSARGWSPITCLTWFCVRCTVWPVNSRLLSARPPSATATWTSSELAGFTGLPLVCLLFKEPPYIPIILKSYHHITWFAMLCCSALVFVIVQWGLEQEYIGVLVAWCFFVMYLRQMRVGWSNAIWDFDAWHQAHENLSSDVDDGLFIYSTVAFSGYHAFFKNKNTEEDGLFVLQKSETMKSACLF